MHHKILIVTFSEDRLSIARIIHAIEQKGGQVIVWYIDKYLTENTLASTCKNGKWEATLINATGTHDLNNLTAIWQRKYTHFGSALKQHMDSVYFDACITEAKETVKGLMTRLAKHTFMLDDFNTMSLADIKEEGLRLAVECGLKIPETCITNDPKTAYQFIQNCKRGAISKTLRGIVIQEEGERAFVQTNDVSNATLEDLEPLRYCPMQFQERIPKKVELRVILIGQKIFTAALPAQTTEKGGVDWRKTGAQTINDWFVYQLPEEMEQKLLRYQKILGLNYGAADIIVTPEDEYFFLELNASGEFNWLDPLFNYQISKEIAHVLMGISPRN